MAVSAGDRGVAVGGNVGGDVNITNIKGEPRPPAYDPPDPPDPDGPIPDPGNLPPGSRMLFGTNENFIGREEPLRTLARALLHDDGATLITQAVQGMGGVGKTQLAAAFAHRYGCYFHGVHWINAAQPEAIESEIALCGQKMAAARETAFPQKLPDQLAWTLAAWQGNGSRLLILDNLEDVGAARQWLGRLCGGPLRVLLTARRTDWPGDMALRRLRLETFTPEESREFLRKTSEVSETSEVWDALAERLGHLPLALALAGRYLKRHRRKRVADYLEELDEMMSHRSMRNWRAELGNPTGHDLDLMATFALSWEEVEDTTAQKLFLMAGYCAPNEPIPYELLERAADLGQDQCDEALDRLTGLGLLEQDADAPDTGPTIHPLLAEYARALILNSQFSILDSPFSILHSLASTLATMTKQALETRLPERFQPLRPHARAVAEWAEGAELEDAGTLWNNLGYHLKMMADYAGARASYERALRIDEAAYGPDHPNVAIRVNNLGTVQQAQGDLEGARASYERALRIDEAAFGPDHPNVAIDVNNLGGVQQALGDLEGARASFERALRIKEQVYGRQHPDTATTLWWLGVIAQEEGNIDQARDYLEETLAIYKKFLPPDHPRIQKVRGHLESLG